MKHLYFCLLLSTLAAPLFGQQFQLTVNNGYGGGTFNAGDTVHIWAGEWPNDRVFWRWIGQANLLEDRGEWHTRLVMPAQNVTVEATTLPMPPNSDLVYEEMPGRDTLKRVFYYFPPNPKGLVWFFHGTGAGVYAWVNAYDNRQLVNLCITDTLAVVITECEESTYGVVDLDNDGDEGQWSFVPSNDNVDFANIRIIRDSFEQRGWLTPDVPNIGVGFSAGGAMALILGWYNQWKVGIDYSTGGVDGAAEMSLSPSMICPNRRDNHPNVGPISVPEAFAHQQQYLDRGVCSEVYVNEPGPLHPQRFKRKPGITLAQSLALFNDLQNNDCLDPDHYLSKSNKDIEDLVVAAPQNWPSLLGLGPQEITFVQDQLAELWTSHHFTPDFNAKSMRFIRNACGISATPEVFDNQKLTLTVAPNPTTGWVTLEGVTGRVQVFNLTGQLVLEAQGPQVDVTPLLPGLYVLNTALGRGKLVRL